MRKIAKTFIGLALISAAPFPVLAGFYDTGNELLEICRKSEAGCIGYVSGVLDTALNMRSKLQPGALELPCIPSGAQNTQASDIVKKFLDENPKYRHFEATSLVIGALVEAYPCK